MTKRALLVMVVALVSAVVSPVVREARADDAVQTCQLTGTPVLAKGLQLYDAARDGKPIAEMVGAQVRAQLVVPEDFATGRAKATIASGAGGLRLEGWLPMGQVPVYAVRDVEVAGKHVQLSAGYRVKPTRGEKGRMVAEMTIAGSEGQTARGAGPCDSFSLDWQRPPLTAVPDAARPYLMKGTSLDLFDKAGGEVVYTLTMVDGASPLFHGVEPSGAFMRVVSRGEIAIDAWVRFGAITPIKKGDRIEQSPAPPAGGAPMVLESPGPVKVATRETAVWAKRDEKERPIGVLTKGAEVYVMAVATSWANVLPKELNVQPSSGGGFWVHTADLR